MPLIESEAAASEAARQLTQPVVEAMRGAGVFGMAMSAAMGGPELSPLEQFDVLEELAAADGAAGWCGMINCDGGLAAGWLGAVAAKELFAAIDQPCALVAMPGGQATEVEGGYRVSGQWAFASGSSHAELFFLNCLVIADGALRTDAKTGLPVMRFMSVPRADVQVLDTWYTTGLAGTASNDVAVSDVFVPAEYTFDLLTGRPVDPAPLYQWQWFLLTKMAAVPLGIARAAIDDACEVAPTKLTMPSMQPISADATVQANIGRATALVRGARAFVRDEVGRTWDTVCAGSLPPEREWAECRLALTTAFHAGKEAVQLIYEALGTTGVYRKSRLDRQMRDTVTAAQHIVSQPKTYVGAGRRLLGLDPEMLGF